jgi:glutamate/aspartate transport system permease protein
MKLDFSIIVEAWRTLLDGMEVTLLLVGVSLVGAILLGTVLATMRLSQHRLVSAAARSYVNLFRTVPLVLAIFWFYFLVPLIIGRPVGALVSALVALVFFEGAYFSEVIRSGIQAVPRGQFAAGLSTGMRPRRVMQSIVLPQAFRTMTPALISQSIILFQSTSLVYVVGLSDFMTTAVRVANGSGRIVEIYLFCAAVYFVLSYGASVGTQYLERRLKL